MDEPVSEPMKKKKRKYTKRSLVKMTVDGKAYSGLSVQRDGGFFILKTAKGSVHVNAASVKVLEITGELQRGPFLQIPNMSGNVSAPQMSGGAVDFAARRKAQIESMMSMPGGFEGGETDAEV